MTYSSRVYPGCVARDQKTRPASPALRNKHFVRHASTCQRKRPPTDLGRCASAPALRPAAGGLGFRPQSAVSFASSLQGDPVELDRPSTVPLQGTSGLIKASVAGRRSQRIWSSREEGMLATLESNCRFLREKSVEKTQMPYFSEEPQKIQKIPGSFRRRRTSAQLDVFDVRMRIQRKSSADQFFVEKSLEEAVAHLKDMQATATDQEHRMALGGMIGELQAGVCRVLFAPDDSIERRVLIHALRLVRNDFHALTQLGRWVPRHGLKSVCGYPGAKRPDVKDFDAFMDSLIRDVEPALGGGMVVRKGSETGKWSEESTHYHVCTRYRRLLQLAELDLESPSGNRKRVDPRVAVKEFPASSPHRTIAGIEMQNPVIVIMRDTDEAWVYSWIPCVLSDQIHQSHDVREELEDWARGFANEVDEWCKSYTTPEGPRLAD
eukprot:TRINITY_DN34233_c0_g1_i1.p1 TRINITY_DN34233_c0_g1~~TRINITY_DN34233_c0_g1_i1.p1  ORF type:complete len:436 (+),score=47.85 TRINITY_DN34233_c0_g1_i1:95-1402(+)